MIHSKSMFDPTAHSISMFKALSGATERLAALRELEWLEWSAGAADGLRAMPALSAVLAGAPKAAPAIV